MFCVTFAFGPHGAQNAFASVLIDVIASKNQLEINKNWVHRGHNLCLFCALRGPGDAICAHLRHRRNRSADLIIIFPFCVLCPQLRWLIRVHWHQVFLNVSWTVPFNKSEAISSVGSVLGAPSAYRWQHWSQIRAVAFSLERNEFQPSVHLG